MKYFLFEKSQILENHNIQNWLSFLDPGAKNNRIQALKKWEMAI